MAVTLIVPINREVDLYIKKLVLSTIKFHNLCTGFSSVCAQCPLLLDTEDESGSSLDTKSCYDFISG